MFDEFESEDDQWRPAPPKWRTVGFKHGVKTRMPSLANGLGWGRRGYEFKGWALTTADANAGNVWKGDWAYVSEPVAKGKSLDVGVRLRRGVARRQPPRGDGRWRLGFGLARRNRDAVVAARLRRVFDFSLEIFMRRVLKCECCAVGKREAYRAQARKIG